VSRLLRSRFFNPLTDGFQKRQNSRGRNNFFRHTSPLSPRHAAGFKKRATMGGTPIYKEYKTNGKPVIRHGQAHIKIFFRSATNTGRAVCFLQPVFTARR